MNNLNVHVYFSRLRAPLTDQYIEDRRKEEKRAASTPSGTSPSPVSSTPTVASTPLEKSTAPLTASTPPVTLTPFLQLPYSSPAPTFTPSSASSATGLSEGLPLHPPLHLPVHPRQSDCVKVITEFMKPHFVEAHSSFGKVPYRIKHMWYIEFGKRYQWDLMHERAIETLGRNGPHFHTRT
ncbi:hypothetical protein M9H77_31334 [Catharanthus roseus]|uniref:Uncharacterized protein n=1 Tax=Catharanthus roseus TaxID=4058 RepID=A0ACB9ZZU4_CATRO|nr:hypothetical protein M9H77_31334 [Catharanthus roseus]